MSRIWKRLLVLSFAVILGTGLLSAFYVIPVLTTDVDPNLMKGQCPGGKDWDLPGSSCHDGLIFYDLPRFAEESTELEAPNIPVRKKRHR